MLRLKGSKDPNVKYIISVHNHHAFIPSLADIFGNAVFLVFSKEDSQHQMAKFVFSRTNITELNRADFNCSNDPDLYTNDNPGLVMSFDGPKTVENCVNDYYQKQLRCQLPWNRES